MKSSSRRASSRVEKKQYTKTSVFQWGSIAIGVTAGGSREIEDANVLPCCLPQVLNGKCEQEAELRTATRWFYQSRLEDVVAVPAKAAQ
jgi:hypothetical protein